MLFMKICRGIYTVCLIILIISVSSLYAQQPRSFEILNSGYFKALELFEKQKYSAAQNHFQKVAEEFTISQTELKTNAEYYSALCAIELFNEDAEYLMLKFIGEHPESLRAKKAVFELAKYYYKNKKYRDAILFFEQVDRFQLSDEELAEFYFKSGYSYFIRNQLENANLAFYEIKDINTEYTPPAIYFYGHIAYISNNYETALENFNRLREDETFSAIVPYYIVQILYLQGKYDEIIGYAPPLLEDAIPNRAPEIAKFIGDAWFQKKQYEKAIPYLTNYAENAKTLTREDRYQLAYSYYQTGNFEKSVSLFERVAGRNDVLSQNAYYLLADCYIRLDQKNKALLAFSSASKMDFDESIKEDALFNFAKITYELSYSPFNEAIKAFNQYIEIYPFSDRIDDVYDFLVMAYMNTRNYKEAFTSLEKIQEKNDRIKEAYQRVAFFRGLELFNNLEYQAAIGFFEKSLQYSEFNPSFEARSLYWSGEVYYRLKEYDEAIEHYNRFLLSPGAFEQEEYKIAHYNLGYAFFNKSEYSEALTWFRRFESFVKQSRSRLLGDVYNRIADCYFIATDYRKAIEYYQYAIDIGIADTDYPLFQKAFTLGLLNKHPEKIDILTKLMDEFPGSAYIDDALFEQGKSYVYIEAPQKAIQKYQTLLDKFPNSSYCGKTLVQIGLVYYNEDQNEEAIKYFKKVVEEFPGTPEAGNAITGLKNVYVDIDDVDTYFTYVRNLKEAINISISEQDSLTYISGENLYMSGNCEKAVDALGKYIERFGQGNFLLNAHFYKAECELSLGNSEVALSSYNYVISKPKNAFTEQSALAAAQINFQLNNYSKALEYYSLLEDVAEMKNNIIIARAGQMRCSFFMENYVSTVEAAKKVLVSDKVSEELSREAWFKMAKSWYALENLEKASENFRKLTTEIKSVEGTEAKYRVAEIYYNQEQYELAEKEIYEFIDMNTPHQYWMAKILILLADVNVAKNDLFQAKHTLQSLIDIYTIPDDGIIEEAQKKLNNILEQEKFQEQSIKDSEIQQLEELKEKQDTILVPEEIQNPENENRI
jgi:tetratricopeptide (TPR) repeat protein